MVATRRSPILPLLTAAVLAVSSSLACGRSTFGTEVGDVEVGEEGALDASDPGDANIFVPMDAGDGGLLRDGGSNAGRDAGRDASVDGGRDASVDGGRDASVDASADAGRDAGGADARVDAGSRDATVPDVGVPDAGDRCANVDCSILDGPCEYGVCDPRNGSCVRTPIPDGTECTDGNTCNGLDTCQRGVCQPQHTVLGDRCADARSLDTRSAGETRTSGSFSCVSSDFAGTCGIAGAPDAAYKLQLARTRRLVFETSGVPSTTRPPVLILQSGCGSTGSELQCEAAARTASRLDETLGPGDYTLWVSRGEASATGYDLKMTVDPQDTCAGATSLTIPRTGESVEMAGSTLGARNDFTASCANGTSSPDHVYKLEVPRRLRLRIETVTTGMDDFDTALHVWTGACPNRGTQLACDDDGAGDQRSRVELDFDPGTYSVVVDGFGAAASGNYILRITSIADPNVVAFPAAGDVRVLQSAAGFQADGDYVEGVRTFAAPTATRLDLNVVVTNDLTCDSHETQVILNGLIIGAFSIGPGVTELAQSFTFSSISGPSYSIRYETARTVTPGCGSIVYSESDSTVYVGN